jgi:hypothetical protein
MQEFDQMIEYAKLIKQQKEDNDQNIISVKNLIVDDMINLSDVKYEGFKPGQLVTFPRYVNVTPQPSGKSHMYLRILQKQMQLGNIPSNLYVDEGGYITHHLLQLTDLNVDESK